MVLLVMVVVGFGVEREKGKLERGRDNCIFCEREKRWLLLDLEMFVGVRRLIGKG